MQAQEFYSLVPAQWQAMCEAFLDQQKRENRRTAAVICAVFNATGRYKMTIDSLLESPAEKANTDPYAGLVR